jgi:hypothetical protein
MAVALRCDGGLRSLENDATRASVASAPASEPVARGGTGFAFLA